MGGTINIWYGQCAYYPGSLDPGFSPHGLTFSVGLLLIANAGPTILVGLFETAIDENLLRELRTISPEMEP
jgi:hypothetical protein